LKLKYDKLLSSFAFKFHLRRSIEAGSLFARLTPPESDPDWRHNALMIAPTVRRCGLTLSNPL